MFRGENMNIIESLINWIKSIFGSRAAVVSQPSPLPSTVTYTVPQKVEITNADLKNQVNMMTIQATTEVLTTSPPATTSKTKEERIRRILDLIVDQVLSEGYKDNVNFELNVIHPEFQPYIISEGAAIAAEYTKEKIQRLNQLKGYLYAEWYTYEALSAQWRKVFANLITQAGQATQVSTTPEGQYAAINRASLHELWRQTVWADKSFADQWLVYSRISDAELSEFLLTLATDDIEFLPKTDKPVSISG